jgi:hypothetical protein
LIRSLWDDHHRRSQKAFLKLCADEEADVQWCDVPSKALALSGELEFILTPQITSEIAYAVAMHELGHIKRRDQSSDQIERERAAWEWARRNALMWTPHIGTLCGCLVAVVRSAAPPLDVTVTCPPEFVTP